MDRKQGWLISGLLTLMTIVLAAGILENTRQLNSLRREMTKQNAKSTELPVDVAEKFTETKVSMNRDASGSTEQSQEGTGNVNELWGPLEFHLVYQTIDAAPVVNAEIHVNTGDPRTLISLGRTDNNGILRIPRIMYSMYEFYIDILDSRLVFNFYPRRNGRIELGLPVMKRVRPRLRWPAELGLDQFVLLFGWDFYVTAIPNETHVYFSRQPGCFFAFNGKLPHEPMRAHYADLKGEKERHMQIVSPGDYAVVDIEKDSANGGGFHCPIHVETNRSLENYLTARVHRYTEKRITDLAPGIWSELVATEQVEILRETDKDHDFSRAPVTVQMGEVNFDGEIEEVEGDLPILWLTPNPDSLEELQKRMNPPEEDHVD